jgi:hypothetical protein
MPELVGIFCFLTVGAIIGSIVLTRHKERLTIIEKGLNPEDIKAMYERRSWAMNPLTSLKWGIVFVFIGAAILLSIWLRETYLVNNGVFPGLIALFGGLGLVVFYFIAKKKKEA